MNQGHVLPQNILFFVLFVVVLILWTVGVTQYAIHEVTFSQIKSLSAESVLQRSWGKNSNSSSSNNIKGIMSSPGREEVVPEQLRVLRNRLAALESVKYRLLERHAAYTVIHETLQAQLATLDKHLAIVQEKIRLCHAAKMKALAANVAPMKPIVKASSYEAYYEEEAQSAPAEDGNGGGGGGDQQEEPSDGYEDPEDTNTPPQPPEGIQGIIEDPDTVIPVLVFAYAREDELRKCLEKIFKVLPKTGFKVFVSQDSSAFPAVTQVANEYVRQGKIVHLIHGRNDSGATLMEKHRGFRVYYAISHHYGWAIGEVFKHGPHYTRVIILEDDLDVAPDFFPYMRAMAKVMDKDPTVYCVSAWNDNGKSELTADPTQVYRSDFFPGLGWLLARRIWDEYQERFGGWPKGFWDDWVRQPAKRRGRSCLRPEVPRTYQWCTETGASRGQFCQSHLMEIRIADVAVPWDELDLTYLEKPKYDAWLQKTLKEAKTIMDPEELNGNTITEKEVKLFYSDNNEFRLWARTFGLMEDFKDNVPRTAYGGVVSFRHGDKRVHLVSRKKLYK